MSSSISFPTSQKSLAFLPTVCISDILIMAAERPSNIALVCKHFTIAQTNAYPLFLRTFAQDPRLNFCIEELSTKEQPVEKVKKIYSIVSQGVKGTRPTEPAPSGLELGKLAEKIHDRDLIVFFNFVQDYLFKKGLVKTITLFNCEDSYDEATKAGSIRQWMNENQSLMEQITEINLENSNLHTVPPEVAFCKNVELFSVRGNQITKTTEVLNLKKLIAVNLMNNKIHKIGAFESLQNLQKLHLDTNKLEKIEGLDNLNKLTHLCFSNNNMKEIPSSIESLPNLKEIHFHENPLSYREMFLGKFLESTYLLNGFTTIKRQEYYQALKKLLASLSTDKGASNIPDQIIKQIRSIEDPLFSILMRETFLTMTISQAKNTDFLPKWLPNCVIDRYFFFYVKSQIVTDSSLNPCSLSYQMARQMISLELIFVHLDKYERREQWKSILDSFSLTAKPLKKAILRHTNFIINENRKENSPIRIGIDTFTNPNSQIVTNEKRSKAIKLAILEITNEETIPDIFERT